MCIRRETREKAQRSLVFSRVSKPHTHITHMLRQCTSIVYSYTYYPCASTVHKYCIFTSDWPINLRMRVTNWPNIFFWINVSSVIQTLYAHTSKRKYPIWRESWCDVCSSSIYGFWLPILVSSNSSWWLIWYDMFNIDLLCGSIKI